MAKFSKSKIAEKLVQSILSAEITPGDRLGEIKLAEFFGVSRTLVREALIELQTRGFVEVRPRMGWYVVEPSFEEARETLQLVGSYNPCSARVMCFVYNYAVINSRAICSRTSFLMKRPFSRSGTAASASSIVA